MSYTNFNTTNEILRKLLGNGLTYQIPSFQRDYSWGMDEWDDLWNDIEALFRDDEHAELAHYMGYLVLQSSDNKRHDVIDGQQRLTTLSIIILAVIKRLEELAADCSLADSEDNKTRAEQLRNSYIGYLDPVTLVSRSKLSLNRHNDDFYQNYMVPLIPMRQRGLRASEHSLRKAFNWFYDRVKAYDNEGKALAALVDGMMDKLFFTTITVTDELNAFKVFETLNARGVKLSSTDLLKNFLFSTVAKTNPHEAELNQMEKLWESIVGTLGSNAFPDFLRTHWNSKNKLVRKNDLFKTIRNEIKDKKQAFSLIRELDHSANTYMALLDGNEACWNEKESKALNSLRVFNTRQQLPLLMAAYQCFYEKDRELFTKILTYIVIIAFRYNVISNLHTNDQERVYVRVAKEISDGSIANRVSLLNALKTLYVEDESFATNFRNKELVTTNSRNNKVVRYVLIEIEYYKTKIPCDMGNSQITIEHVYPQNPDENWEEADQSSTYLIGNMVLLELFKNKEIENLSYTEKRPILRSSQYALASQLAEKYEMWNRELVLEHQANLAKDAVQIWRIDFSGV